MGGSRNLGPGGCDVADGLRTRRGLRPASRLVTGLQRLEAPEDDPDVAAVHMTWACR